MYTPGTVRLTLTLHSKVPPSIFVDLMGRAKHVASVVVELAVKSAQTVAMTRMDGWIPTDGRVWIMCGPLSTTAAGRTLRTHAAIAKMQFRTLQTTRPIVWIKTVGSTHKDRPVMITNILQK